MILFRAFAVWLVIIAVETVHGILRTLLLVPMMGDFPARQISVFTGSLLIFGVTLFLIKWIAARTRLQLVGVPPPHGRTVTQSLPLGSGVSSTVNRKT